MLDYPALVALGAVIDCGSFEGAALRLRITPSAVSQRIKSLEDRMGSALVIRGQPCRGTPEGMRLAHHLERVQLLEADLDPAARPVVRVAVNADSLATWVLPALSRVEGRLFDLVVDDQDHSADWLRRGEVMAAISSQPDPVPGCDVRRLGYLRYVATASPAFAARYFANGPDAAGLAIAPSLRFNQKDTLQEAWARRVFDLRTPLPAHRIASSEAFLHACELGLGWGLNPEPLVARALSDGRLVQLHPQPEDVVLYWHVARRMQHMMQHVSGEILTAAADFLRPMNKSA